MILNNLIPASGKNICGTIANVSYAITSAFFCNTSQVPEVLNLYLVSSSGGLGNTSQIINTLSIPAGDTFVLDNEKIILENGDYLYATSANSNLSAVISVMDIT